MIRIAGSESEKRALVLQNTEDWLEKLLDEWTVLYVKQEMDQSRSEAGSYGSASGHDLIPTGKTEGMHEPPGRPSPPSRPPASTLYATSGGKKLSLRTEE